jgi:hypothetical protein
MSKKAQKVQSFDEWQRQNALTPITERVTDSVMHQRGMVKCFFCEARMMPTKKGMLPIHRYQARECPGSLRTPSHAW